MNGVHIFVDGWSELRRRRWYWATLCAHAVWNLADSVFFVRGLVVVTSAYHGRLAWGVVSTGLAVGSLLGGLVAYRWRARRPLVAGHLVLALSALELLVLTRTLPLVATVVAALAAAGAVTFLNEVWAAVMQRLIPEAVISRLSSYEWLISSVVQPIGFAIVGPVAPAAGIKPTLWWASLLMVLPCMAIPLLPEIRRLRQATDGTLSGAGIAVADPVAGGTNT